ENVTFAARIRGIERGVAERSASDRRARFGMSARAGLAVRGFSTGQRKRVALARALLHGPEVLFLDEPTSGLDPEATRDVLDLLATMAREHGRTVVVCTHFLAEAGRLADRLAMLHHGRLHAFGRLDEIAAGLWDDLGVDLELGAPADGATPRPDVHPLLGRLPHSLGSPIARLPEREQLVVLVDGYLVAPLFLIVPLMVASVLAADAFAGEKERKTLESLLHLPISDERLFYAKVIGAFGPAVGVAWIGFVLFAIVANTLAWPLTHRIFVPTRGWGVLILWIAPGVAALGMSVMVRVSARARTAQEANQLGGSVILPL